MNDVENDAKFRSFDPLCIKSAIFTACDLRLHFHD